MVLQMKLSLLVASLSFQRKLRNGPILIKYMKRTVERRDLSIEFLGKIQGMLSDLAKNKSGFRLKERRLKRQCSQKKKIIRKLCQNPLSPAADQKKLIEDFKINPKYHPVGSATIYRSSSLT